MQARFDGRLGFPGGLLDKEGESPVEALNREVEEEMGVDLAKHRISQEGHVCSHIHHQKKLVTHFYAKEITLEEYKEIEKAAVSCDEWGIEVSIYVYMCMSHFLR